MKPPIDVSVYLIKLANTKNTLRTILNKIVVSRLKYIIQMPIIEFEYKNIFEIMA